MQVNYKARLTKKFSPDDAIDKVIEYKKVFCYLFVQKINERWIFIYFLEQNKDRSMNSNLNPIISSPLCHWEKITEKNKISYKLIGQEGPINIVRIESEYSISISLIGKSTKEIFNLNKLRETLDKIYSVVKDKLPAFSEIIPKITEDIENIGIQSYKINFLNNPLLEFFIEPPIIEKMKKPSLVDSTSSSTDKILSIGDQKSDHDVFKIIQSDPNLEPVAYYKEILKQKTILDLSKKNIGDTEAIALAEALKDENIVVHTVNLSGNKIGRSGIEALSIALKINKTVCEFDISGNPIGDCGAIFLSQTLIVNKILKSLLLSSCEIGEEGANAIALSLMKNGTLNTLDLLYNKITAQGGSFLAIAMKTNGSLTTFTQFGNKISNSDRQIISEELRLNRNIGIRKNLLRLSDKPNEEKNDSWKISHQKETSYGIMRVEPNESWTLYNSEKHQGKLKEITYNLKYQEHIEHAYDSYGVWTAIDYSGRNPIINIGVYMPPGESQLLEWESDLINSLARSNITINKNSSSIDCTSPECYQYINFTVKSPNLFIFEKLLIAFVERGDLSKEKAAEFLKLCPER